MAVGMAANAIAETRYGQHLFDIQEMGRSDYVPDQSMVDFAYGTAAAVGAGAMLVGPKNHAAH
jgi:hypothetical protein